MATIWHAEQGQWHARSLEHNQHFAAVDFGQAGWQIHSLGGTPGYSLMVWPHVAARVNGEQVGTVTVLQHRDEIHIGGQCLCFSAHSRPEITVFNAEPGRRAPKCGVCSAPIADGDTIVCCPVCGRRYHFFDATADRPEKHCFNYEPITKCCGHPTDLDGANLWQPESDIAPEVSHAS